MKQIQKIESVVGLSNVKYREMAKRNVKVDVKTLKINYLY